jgi:hypothetical protein
VKKLRSLKNRFATVVSAIMAGWQDMNGSMGQTVTFGIAHNSWSAEEKVDILKSERSMNQDLRVLSIRSVSSAVGRTLIPNVT